MNKQNKNQSVYNMDLNKGNWYLLKAGQCWDLKLIINYNLSLQPAFSPLSLKLPILNPYLEIIH